MGLLNIVWFKRDLRLRDHRPLSEAAERGAVLPLLILEPSVLNHGDLGDAWRIVYKGTVCELDENLSRRGSRLYIVRGEAVEVLETIRQSHGNHLHLWSHEETGNGLTFARDRAVAKWVRTNAIPWTEFPQTGVIRGLRDRDGWARTWHERMATAPAPEPPRLQAPSSNLREKLAAALPLDPGMEALACPSKTPDSEFPPGECAAWKTLQSFLSDRGKQYHREMSAPLTAYQSCSRLSTYLATGSISLRELVQTTRRFIENKPEANKRAFSAFLSRCHWHCHFMQKLETEPAIEHRCFHPGYENVRANGSISGGLDAWINGYTGYPFLDACMRALRRHGWINFRMRAMLVSFAAYDLWLDWRVIAHPLARLFADYEPGIHYSQVQMQSGTTGINTLRIYSPVKQGLDHDPHGLFIRQYVPELSAAPTHALHEPWKHTSALHQVGIRVGKEYPLPIVDHAEAVRTARARIAEARRQPGMWAANRAVYERHGSRKGPVQRRIHGQDAAVFSRLRNKDPDPRQTTLPIDE